jgi:hypothetical protein
MKRPKIKRPSEYQAKMLRHIARAPMMKTNTEDGPVYLLQDGTTVPKNVAEILIRNCWVRPQQDGLWAGADQTFVALKPGSAASSVAA